jgi:hypothetical protein
MGARRTHESHTDVFRLAGADPVISTVEIEPMFYYGR